MIVRLELPIARQHEAKLKAEEELGFQPVSISSSDDPSVTSLQTGEGPIQVISRADQC
jgi:hypothetical protein